MTTETTGNKGLVAQATITINAPIGKVWDAFTKPEMIKQYMFGTNVITDWKEGSTIIWRGEWQGKPYEDKGVILKLIPGRLIQYSHYSPLSGQPDTPENHHVVTGELSPEGNGTKVVLSQDNNASEEERDHSAKNWTMMLDSLKRYLEEG